MTTAAASSTSSSLPPDSHPDRWRMLVLLAVAELLGMALWFTGSAVGPTLAQSWSLTASEVGWLTTAVQLGFVCGTAMSALLNLADVVPSRRLFALAAVAGALANAPLAFTSSYTVALISRFLAGVCLAGVYPPAMKMASTWFRARRGVAVGTIVGALTVGKASPYLAQAIPGLDVAAITLGASLSALLAAAIVWMGYRDGPYEFPARAFSWARVRDVIRERRWRLATGGYLGHMAELYSFWTWIPSFLVASDAARAARVAGPANARIATLIGFGVIAVGGIGCVWGGLVADKIGRARLVTLAMAISGSCALAIGFAWAQSWWLLAPLALVWGFFVIADSAQFSVLVTESVPAHTVGTALTLQVSIGFLLTTITIQLIPPLVSWLGWQWVFPILSIGPLLGILSIRRLRAG
ncbi:MAG: MFS transporter [Gemmatimonadaceae bacterium]|nr:MFS transporter [Gemmatimonadaceae bacterium]